MSALLAIAWFLMLLLAICLIFMLVGLHRMVHMLPEGKRWWLFPSQLASLAFFAALVHFNPF